MKWLSEYSRKLVSELIAVAATCLLAPVSAAEVDFNRDVRPILTKNCTTCHGGVKKAGGVSFLYREDVLGKGESGQAVVVPGNAEASEMIRRILTSDPDDRMPPPDHHPKPLPREEIVILTEWVRQGAEWGEHWAYQKPEMPDIPKVEDSTWPKTDSDKFILRKLMAEGLVPSPDAEPSQWLRRVTLDLTGLPLTLEDFEKFQKVAEEGGMELAMTQVVDRLLASDAYGEHWAAMWLDLARYSDTFGFEKDPHRNIWPWRDWVIKAFNEDMPYDKFTIKQLAGDLLPDPGPYDLIATAFHRNTQNNTEGGTDDEEWRMAAVIDRTNTTWTAWNGVTFGCVQCHDHPYDPIQHREYYEFMAFLNNAEDVDISSDFPHTKVASDPDRQEEVVRLEKEIRKRRSELNDVAREVAERIDAWAPLDVTKTSAHPDTGRLLQNDKGEFITSGTNPTRTQLVIESHPREFSALKIRILPESDDPKEWDETGVVISQLDIDLVSTDGKPRRIAMNEVVSDFLAGPFDPNKSIVKEGDKRRKGPGWGEYPMLKGPRTGWFVPEQSVVPQEGELIRITIHHAMTCNETQNTVLRRFTAELSDDTRLVEYLSREEREEKWRELENLEARYKSIKGINIPTIVEREAAGRRPTRVFIRGNRMTLDEKVDPAIPSLFEASSEPADRLEMAEWIVGKENPLAARVLANRLWAHLFGIGIVETQEDFGSSGSLPSHPELLDYLALRLRDHHQWRIKPFLKELVLSSTYRQSSRATPELLEKDPRNRLLARGPRQRLTAEMVRDQALVVSGLMVHQVGGKPVYPPQPEGIWNSVYNGQKWKDSTGPDRFRRAIYTYHKRTAGHPTFLTFDASARDVCLPRRISTNTPLQALVTLNDPAHMEFAQAFAKRMESAGSDLRQQLAHGYRLLTLRRPETGVIDMLAELHEDLEVEYGKDPAKSSKLASTPREAALVLVANTLLNSDFALNR